MKISTENSVSFVPEKRTFRKLKISIIKSQMYLPFNKYFVVYIKQFWFNFG